MAKVLIVEDDKDIRTAYVYAMTRAGMEVTEASDGTQAVALVEQVRPQVILLDMLMPGMSGLDFLKQTNVLQKYPDTKVIAFSNIETPRVISEAKELGVSEYILKVDMTPHDMVEKINQVAGQPSASPTPGPTAS